MYYFKEKKGILNLTAYLEKPVTGPCLPLCGNKHLETSGN